MRILIGYDGSDFSAAAIEDLRRAGLPAGCEARVISVADIWPSLPPQTFAPLDPQAMAQMTPIRRRAHTLAQSAMQDAKELAAQGADLLRSRFSGWNISSEAVAGSTATVLVEQARSWKADLIVVGSEGRGAIGRAMLGSVSHGVLTHAPCSVRIGRRGKRADIAPDVPVRMVIGLDGSPNAAAALNAVCQRVWPGGTEVRAVIALDLRLTTIVPSLSPDFSWPLAVDTESQEWPRQAADAAVTELKRAGLTASAVVREGDPKRVLIEESDAWPAECIVVGARGMSRIQGFLLGSVSSTVAARASCSVEVVRFE